MDPKWTPEESREALEDVTTLRDAMAGLGHGVELLAVEDAHLAPRLRAYDPRSLVVFNWCEELPGLSRSEPLAAAILERLDFVFTGSPSGVLARSLDKPLIKRILDARRIPTPPWAVFEEPRDDGWDVFPAIVKAAH